MKRIVVVGGGISGLSTARQLLEHGDFDLVVTEAAPRPGGTIETIRSNGFVVEAGPNGFLSSRRETVRLVEALATSGGPMGVEG